MRLLIVEDDVKIARALKEGLERESFAVDLSFDGDAGLGMALSESYDVIILDVMLPKLDGFEFCRVMREEEHDFTPILMLTARGHLEDKVFGLNLGCDDYLVKPFSFDELLARIRALIRRKSGIVSNILYTHNLKLDTNTLTVTRNGVPINLSRREFSLLEYLLRNKGKVVSKDQIMEHVWDFESNVLPNTVEVYIGYLRNKIDKPFKKMPSLVSTVRGFGYKIEDIPTPIDKLIKY